ncbi:MAG: GNAT family N-acetyltransferase [Acidobacteriota bacterium]
MHAELIAFDTLRHGDQWKRWGELAAEAPPFLAPEFFALTRPFAAGGEPLVAGSWEDGHMTGALPLVLDHHTLRALRGDYSPRYDFCGTRAGIAAIWEKLREDPRWSELVLDKVPRDSLLAADLPVLALSDGCPAIVRADSRQPYFALPGFEARMKPKFRTNLLRCARRAGDLVLERILLPTRADLDEANAIEAMAWKAAAGTHIAADPRAEHMYRALARLLGRRGQASLTFLRIGGKRVAALFSVEDHRTLFALKLGYDPSYASLSPGHLIVWKVAADAEQRGLQELDFVGHEDDWKRKWTDEVRDHVSIVIYRRDARGLFRYALREVVKPRLPEQLRETPRSPLPRRCQHADRLGAHGKLALVRNRVLHGFGIRRRITGAVKRLPQPPRLGEPSKFLVGSWVRVKDEAAIRALLDASDRTRGLQFTPAQFKSCGGVYKVDRLVTRLRDDNGRFRPVSRTVLLHGVDCSIGGPELGCGRHCPLMFRDEWLEPASAPKPAPPPRSTVRHARVRDRAEIERGLDLFGRRDGVTFMPEMARFAGKRLAIAGTLDRVFELDHWIAPRAPIYLLDGAQCTGAVCGDDGPCDRACTLLWHRDWLILEDA